MRKTLLLVFIHGFKGGETTFGNKYRFTDNLRDSVAERLPKVRVRILVYPKFETRGNLHECVGRFQDWLLNKVIDHEVQAKSHSPTVDPTVRTVLIGHSMGGIVAAETIIRIATENAIGRRSGSSTPSPSTRNPSPTKQQPDGGAAASAAAAVTGTSTSAYAADPSNPLNSLMFPYIQGVLAFDTPYIGISPGVVAHSAEGHIKTANTALNTFNEFRSTLWGGSSASTAAEAAKALPPAKSAATSAASAAAGSSASTAAGAAASGGWGKWSTVAVAAGAVSALAAGGAAAYIKRGTITEGWGWATSHLVFVSCLTRKEELRQRLAAMVRLRRELNVGFANIYNRLGKKATSKTTVVGTVVGTDRTFCNLPSKEEAGEWREAVNENATDETWAHMSMFEEELNPGYRRLVKDATDLITEWVKNDWYEESEERLAISNGSAQG